MRSKRKSEVALFFALTGLFIPARDDVRGFLVF